MTMSIADVNAARTGKMGPWPPRTGRGHRPKRRTFTREYKMRVLEQYETAATPKNGTPCSAAREYTAPISRNGAGCATA